MSYHVLVGKTFTVAAANAASDNWTISCPAVDFLFAMEANPNYAGSCKGYRALFDRFATHGQLGLTAAMFHEANKNERIYEFINGGLSNSESLLK